MIISNVLQTLLLNNTLSLSKGVSDSYEKQIESCIVNPQSIKVTLDDIGGLNDIKEDIKTQILLPLKHPSIFFDPNNETFRPSKGVLLYGPPGTGKTMLAKAIAKEAHVPFISLTLATLEDKYFGESSKLLSALFRLAQKMQPCIIFLDEIDGMIRTRSDHDQSCVYGLKTEFLNHMDGVNTQKNDSVFVIGCTNNPKSLDPAIKRRLPKIFEISLPSLEERLDILKITTKNTNTSHQILTNLAKMTTGFSGSDLCELFQRANGERIKQSCKDANFLNRLSVARCAAEMHGTMQKISPFHWTVSLNSMMKEKGNILQKTEELVDHGEERPPDCEAFS